MTFLEEKGIKNEFKQERPQELSECCFQPVTAVFLVKEILEAGKVVPVMDRRYPLSETAEAIRYLEEGHAHGKVVITVEHN
jgi:NADPH:quinone reductase-like Zn-dependent oxidoreductase